MSCACCRVVLHHCLQVFVSFQQGFFYFSASGVLRFHTPRHFVPLLTTQFHKNIFFRQISAIFHTCCSQRPFHAFACIWSALAGAMYLFLSTTNPQKPHTTPQRSIRETKFVHRCHSQEAMGLQKKTGAIPSWVSTATKTPSPASRLHPFRSTSKITIDLAESDPALQWSG